MAEAVKRKDGWAARYRDPQSGERLIVPHSPLYDTKAEAEVAAKDFEDSIRNLKAGDWFDPRTTTLLMYIHRVIEDMRVANEPQPQTISGYEKEVGRLIAPFPIANMLMTQIRADDVEDDWWKDEIRVIFNNMIASQQSAKRMMSLFLGIAHARSHAPGLKEVPRKVLKIQAHREVKFRKRGHRLTEDEYDVLLETTAPEAHLMWVETAGESGCRPEEVIALEPTQFLWATNELHVYRSVVWLTKKDAIRKNGGERVKINDFTKTKDDRTVPMPPEYMARMRAFIDKHEIKDGELIFSRARMGVGPMSQAKPWVDLSQLTGTITGPNGRLYRHGTALGYDMGKCREDCCKAAKRQAGRKPPEDYKTQGKDGRRLVRPPELDACPLGPWLVRFRAMFVAAGIHWDDVEPYDMRHFHAIRLAHDPEMTANELQHRLGHDSFETTQDYIDEARASKDSHAVRHLSRRYQQKEQASAPTAGLTTAAILAEIQRLSELLAGGAAQHVG